jgi:hypothetical protein
MSKTETVISPKRIKDFEQELVRHPGEPDSFIILDLLRAIRSERKVTRVEGNVFDAVQKYAVDVVCQSEKLLTRKEFMEELRGLLESKEISWIDTDLESFDWTDIHTKTKSELFSALGEKRFRTAYIGVRREDGQTDYLTYSVTE